MGAHRLEAQLQAGGTIASLEPRPLLRARAICDRVLLVRAPPTALAHLRCRWCLRAHPRSSSLSRNRSEVASTAAKAASPCSCSTTVPRSRGGDARRREPPRRGEGARGGGRRGESGWPQGCRRLEGGGPATRAVLGTGAWQKESRSSCRRWRRMSRWSGSRRVHRATRATACARRVEPCIGRVPETCVPRDERAGGSRRWGLGEW